MEIQGSSDYLICHQKQKKNTLGFIKLENLVQQKTISKKLKTWSIGWKNIFVNNIYDKDLVSRIHKEFLQLNNRDR